MKKSIASVFAAMVVMGASQLTFANSETAVAQAPAPGLVEVKNGAFQSTWVNPEVDFRQYQRVVIAEEGALEFRDVGHPQKSRARMLHANERVFGVPERDRERVGRHAGESFVKSLSRSKHYEVIDDSETEFPVKGTLILRGHMLDVVSKVPPPIAGSGAVYGNVMGEATLVIELFDAESGEMVAFVAERSNIQRSGSFDVGFVPEMNSATAMAEVRRWASRAGMRLAKGLDGEHKV